MQLPGLDFGSCMDYTSNSWHCSIEYRCKTLAIDDGPLLPLSCESSTLHRQFKGTIPCTTSTGINMNEILKAKIGAFNLNETDYEIGFHHCRAKLVQLHHEGVFTAKNYQAKLKMLCKVFGEHFHAPPVARNAHLSMTLDDLTLIGSRAEQIRRHIENNVEETKSSGDASASVTVRDLRISTEKYCEFDGHISLTDSKVRASYTLDIRMRKYARVSV